MASIKFAKNGKTYKLLSKATKVTTPSIRIGNNYTPLFEGRPESEVIHGDMIYTLSPLKVGKYNAAYKERPNFDGRVYAEISTLGLGYLIDPSAVTAGFQFTGSITKIYTAQPGFTCKLGTTDYHDSGYIVLAFPYNYYFTFSSSYQVISNVTNEIVSEGTFSCRVGRLEAWTAPGYRRTYTYDIKNNRVFY